MKGLLTKDFQLILMQRKFLLLVFGIAVFMGLSMEEPSFLIGYLTFMCAILVLGTISYDDYEHGYPFLFTLPVTRKGYVIEKYVLSLIVCTAAWGISTLFAMVISLLKTGNLTTDFSLTASLSVLAACLLMLCIMLPLQMKFGAEKSRIVMISILGICMVIGYLLKLSAPKLQKIIPLDIEGILLKISSWNETCILGAMCLICILLIGITMLISIRVMEKKQF